MVRKRIAVLLSAILMSLCPGGARYRRSHEDYRQRLGTRLLRQ